MKKFWESIHKKRPQMEKGVKTFERVNTSKGGRAIPEDQRPDCFFFVAVQCNFRYVCSHEGMSRPPHAETTLSSILPCVDEQTTNQTLAQIKVVINSIVTVVNTFVTVVNTFVYALANTNPSPGQNFYYNQSRPPMPPLCSSFDSNMEDRECGTWELSIGNASSSYICEVTKSDVCTTVGRVTPEIYKQLVAVVNESYDCNFVRDTFESITSDYCPPLERNLRVVNAGLGMISVRDLECCYVWCCGYSMRTAPNGRKCLRIFTGLK